MLKRWKYQVEEIRNIRTQQRRTKPHDKVLKIQKAFSAPLDEESFEIQAEATRTD